MRRRKRKQIDLHWRQRKRRKQLLRGWLSGNTWSASVRSGCRGHWMLGHNKPNRSHCARPRQRLAFHNARDSWRGRTPRRSCGRLGREDYAQWLLVQNDKDERSIRSFWRRQCTPYPWEFQCPPTNCGDLHGVENRGHMAAEVWITHGRNQNNDVEIHWPCTVWWKSYLRATSKAAAEFIGYAGCRPLLYLATNRSSFIYSQRSYNISL